MNNLIKNNVILTITGPSLAGKSILANELMKRFDVFKSVVTHTTRNKRKGEENGISYHFVSKNDFKELIDSNSFIEYAEVGPVNNKEFYGASKLALNKVFEEGKNPLFVIEPQGANNLAEFAKENNYNIVQVFINNDRQILFRRLFERYDNDDFASAENYAKRLINMIDVEPEKWIKPALTGEQFYDLIIPKFDQNNDEVIDAIINKINEKLSFTEKKRFKLK